MLPEGLAAPWTCDRQTDNFMKHMRCAGGPRVQCGGQHYGAAPASQHSPTAGQLLRTRPENSCLSVHASRQLERLTRRSQPRSQALQLAGQTQRAFGSGEGPGIPS